MIKRPLIILLLVLLNITIAMAQDEPDSMPLFQFPLLAPTDEQIQSAYDCELPIQIEEITALEASDIALEDMSDCELALEAIKLAVPGREEGTLSDDAKDLLMKAIMANPAMAQKLAMLVYFYGTVDLVSPPEFADQPITQVTITYEFFGLGNSLTYELQIDDADSSPLVSGDVFNDAPSGEEDSEGLSELSVTTLDSELLQAFASALRDLMPIGEYFSIINCTDFYPDWVISLTFEDKTQVTLLTNGTNIIGQGGPYQTTLDDQKYMQYSAALEDVIIPIFEALELPFGETAGMSCSGISDPIFDAFPQMEDE